MAGHDSELSLGQLLQRGITSAAKVAAADSPNDPAVQTQLQAGLSDLTLSSSLISRLGVLSPNETLDDINTRDLRCILVDCLRGELEVLAKTKSGRERIQWLTRAQGHFRDYIALVDRYEIIPEEKRGVFAGPQHATQDPSRRRESKIAQFKMEREIKGKLEELRKRRTSRRPKISSSSTTPSASTAPAVPEEEEDEYDSDDDDTEVSRPLFVNLLQLHYLRAHTELSSIDQELELLQTGMTMSDLPRESGRAQGERESRRAVEEEDGTWKVERLGEGKEGPLLDPEGKVLRPFTILPSSTSHLSTRLRLQSEVFRDGHRLPTMTIEEFLEQEEANGRILQGGGPASSDAVAQERKDQAGLKEDDTEEGYRRDEEETIKARVQDEWRDTHRKGEGNMHNRG